MLAKCSRRQHDAAVSYGNKQCERKGQPTTTTITMSNAGFSGTRQKVTRRETTTHDTRYIVKEEVEKKLAPESKQFILLFLLLLLLLSKSLYTRSKKLSFRNHMHSCIECLCLRPLTLSSNVKDYYNNCNSPGCSGLLSSSSF